MVSHFSYIGAHGIFQVSSWKSVFASRLWDFNEDEVHGVVLRVSADLVGRFLSTFCSYFPIQDLSFRVYRSARDISNSF